MRPMAKAAKRTGLVISALMCALGIMIIIMPDLFSKIIGLVLGVALLVFGCSKLFGYFSGDAMKLMFGADLAFGVALIALGVMFLTHPDSLTMMISLAAGIYVLADGASKLANAIQSQKLGFKAWWVLLVLALITGAFGVILMFYPGDVLMVLLGISLLCDGALNIVTLLTLEKYVNEIQAEAKTIEGEGEEK